MDAPPAPDDQASCRLSRLSLTDFRNHGAFDLACDAPLVVITGPNGAGKTNILEAVSLLAPGRGLRRAPLMQMARQGGPGGFAVSAGLLPADIQIGTGIAADAQTRRLVRINGAQTSANSLGEWLSVLWLTPAMDRLFMEGAGERRRFIDRLVLALQPAHARAASRYEAAMRERNRLLSDERAPDPAWMDAIEARMAEYGSAIIAARAHMVDALAPRLANAPDGPFARPVIALAHAGGEAAGTSPPADPDALMQLWRDGRARDRAAGRTLSGPHRADLSVKHAAKEQAAALCSTGEQKALLLSIILAHAGLVQDARGHAPILLLDEVAAHLDEHRRAALIERLSMLSGQMWMTGTDRSLFSAAEEKDALFLSLEQTPASHANA